MLIHAIISPNTQMMCHANLFVKSFVKNSEIENYQLSLTVGPDVAPDFRSIRILCNDKFSINQYTESKHGFSPPYLGGIQRWTIEQEDEVSLFIDMDTIVCGSLKEIQNECLLTQRVLGVLNIGSPFKHLKCDSRTMWDRVARAFQIEFNYVNNQGVAISQFDEKHYSIPDNYFNYGFLMVPKVHLNTIKESLHEFVAKTVEVLGDNFWNGEIALCAAISKLAIPIQRVSIKYNYPDRTEFFNSAPNDDIRVLHMVRKTIKQNADILKLMSSSTHNNLVEEFISKKLISIYGAI